MGWTIRIRAGTLPLIVKLLIVRDDCTICNPFDSEHDAH